MDIDKMAKPKYTILRARSVEKGLAITKKVEKEILKMKGVESIKYDIEILKSRIHNVEGDIKNFGSNLILKHKLEEMEKNLKLKEEELNNLQNQKEKDGN